MKTGVYWSEHHDNVYYYDGRYLMKLGKYDDTWMRSSYWLSEFLSYRPELIWEF